MTKAHVKETFQRIAAQYDDFIKRVIPYYREQHEIILSYIPYPSGRNIRLLDLGIGTGELSELILKRYPCSFMHGIDLSEKMIEISRARLAKHARKIHFSVGLLESEDFIGKYEAVFAGLSIHHLTNAAKRKIFRKIYRHTKPHGVFIMRDLFLSKSPRMNKVFHEKWNQFEIKNGVDPRKISKDRKSNDIPATLEDQIQWLKLAGFKNVDCVWKYNNFGIIAAYR